MGTEALVKKLHASCGALADCRNRVSCISGPRSDCPSCSGWPIYRRPCSIAGLFISSGALAVSSFATHVWQLILIPALSLHHARPRIHVAARTRDGRASRRTPSLRFVLPRRFLVYQLGNVLHGLGYFLPSYARARPARRREWSIPC